MKTGRGCPGFEPFLLHLTPPFCWYVHMQISKEDIEEFKQLYYEEFSIYLLDKDAEEIASNLVRLYTLLSKKLPSEHNITPPESPSQE